MSNLRAWLAEKSSEETELFLGEVPRLWLESRQVQKFCRLLTDFDFIEAKINHLEFGVQALIEDYDLIENAELSTNLEYNAQTVEALKLIQGALRLSAHILIQDTKQLAGQLSGRLLYFYAPEIQKLLQQISQSQTTCLRSLTSSLTTPNEPLIRTLTGHSGSVWSVSVTPDGEQVISGSQDGTIKIWNLNLGNLIYTISAHDDSVDTIAITADGLYVISGSRDTTIKIWNLKTGQLVRTLRGHYGSVNTVILTPDGSKIISASSDYSLKIWNIKTGEVLHTLIGHTRSVQAVTIVFSKNNKWVISGSYDKTIKVWNLETGKEELALNESHWVGCITATPDGKRVISALEDGTLTVWKVGTWEKEYILKGHNNSVRTVAVTPDGKRIISGSSYDGTLKIWKVETWENEATFTGHTAWVLAVAVTPNAKQIISASGNNIFSSEFTIKVWSLEKCIEAFSLKAERNTITAHSDSVEVVAFTPDGEYVISAAKDDNFKLWKVGTWENEASFTGESKSALALGDYAVITGYKELENRSNFVSRLTTASENNFMYLHHILNAIAEDFDSQPYQFDCIPPGLEAYYQQHWQKMKSEGLSDLVLKVLSVLTCAETGEISAKGISQAISQRLDASRTAEDEYDVEEILENWLEFLQQHRIGKETRYSFYHSHFRLWLAKQISKTNGEC